MRNPLISHSIGLCQGRHEIPGVTEYVFGNAVDPTDTKGLYQQASDKLTALFPDYEIRTTCLHNQADYTDIPVYVRGELTLYVTGLTVALIATLNAAKCLGIEVVLMHFDVKTSSYYKQNVL